jgi:release factor glutamine methyltransferase
MLVASRSAGVRPDSGPSSTRQFMSAESVLRESGLPRSEGLLLLARMLGIERSRLMAHPETEISPQQCAAARGWFERRRAGEPVAYLIEEREFYGLSLRVTPDVLIPRPETERLVELALDRISPGAPARLLELGTGSGAVAIALASARPALEVTATDVSQAALAVAQHNALRHGAAIEFALGSWFQAVGGRRFDLIVSNPPYVAAHDPHLERGDLRFEPRLALLGGEDGMDSIGCIADRGRNHLVSGGWILFEHGYDQRDRCMESLHALGYCDVADFSDLAGLSRVCVARWRG